MWCNLQKKPVDGSRERYAGEENVPASKVLRVPRVRLQGQQVPNYRRDCRQPTAEGNLHRDLR